MRLLYIGSQQQHSHCYGGDFLYAGFCELLGPANVYAWPEQETLHAGPRGVCELCKHGYDSVQAWPRKDHSLEEAIRVCDVAILACQPGDHTVRPPAHLVENADAFDGTGRRRAPQHWADMDANLMHFRQHWPESKPVAVVDMSDSVPGLEGSLSVQDLRGFYAHALGQRLTMARWFKRELPLRHRWATPCPLSYPASRVPRGQVTKYSRVFYHAAAHPDTPDSPGAPRRQIVNDLRAQIAPELLDVRLYESASERPSPSVYHARMTGASIAVSWNGAVAWDCNRFWEAFAFGCAVVAERPRIEIPNMPEDAAHCVYVDSPGDMVVAVQELLARPDAARAMALRGHQHFLRYHTSEKRAAYVLAEMGRDA